MTRVVGSVAALLCRDVLCSRVALRVGKLIVEEKEGYEVRAFVDCTSNKWIFLYD